MEKFKSRDEPAGFDLAKVCGSPMVIKPVIAFYARSNSPRLSSYSSYCQGNRRDPARSAKRPQAWTENPSWNGTLSTARLLSDCDFTSWDVCRSKTVQMRPLAMKRKSPCGGGAAVFVRQWWLWRRKGQISLFSNQFSPFYGKTVKMSVKMDIFSFICYNRQRRWWSVYSLNCRRHWLKTI